MQTLTQLYEQLFHIYIYIYIYIYICVCVFVCVCVCVFIGVRISEIISYCGIFTQVGGKIWISTVKLEYIHSSYIYICVCVCVCVCAWVLSKTLRRDWWFLSFSDYCLHLYYYFYNVSADRSSGLLQSFVELYVLTYIYICIYIRTLSSRVYIYIYIYIYIITMSKKFGKFCVWYTHLMSAD